MKQLNKIKNWIGLSIDIISIYVFLNVVIFVYLGYSPGEFLMVELVLIVYVIWLSYWKELINKQIKNEL